MKKVRAFTMAALGCMLLAGCSAFDSVSPEERWGTRLDSFQTEIDDAAKDIAGVEDFSTVLGPSKTMVQGDGTFIGDGQGTANLAGVGIVTGEITEGIVKIQGTRDVDITGLERTGTEGDFTIYQGSGFFTATSDVAQHIEVIVDGDCWVIGSGTGMVLFSGNGWAFWYH